MAPSAQELRKVRELAASAPQAEQEAARQRSHQSDAEIASRVRHARAARAHYVAKERAITALRCVLLFCDCACQVIILREAVQS